MKEINFLLKFYTQAQLAVILGYKHRSSLTHILKTKKIPLHKHGIISKEYSKCLQLQKAK